MVGPSLSDEERKTATLRLRVGFVAFVGLSAGLVALQLGPTPLQFVAAVVGGAAVGLLLLVYLLRITGSTRR